MGSLPSYTKQYRQFLEGRGWSKIMNVTYYADHIGIFLEQGVTDLLGA